MYCILWTLCTCVHWCRMYLCYLKSMYVCLSVCVCLCLCVQWSLNIQDPWLTKLSYSYAYMIRLFNGSHMELLEQAVEVSLYITMCGGHIQIYATSPVRINYVCTYMEYRYRIALITDIINSENKMKWQKILWFISFCDNKILKHNYFY